MRHQATFIIIYFENVHFCHAMLGLDICPHEVPPHIHEYPLKGCKLSTFICHYPHRLTLFPSLPIPPLTSPPFYRPIPNYPHSSTPDAQTHSPHPPHSAHPEGSTYKSTLRFLSFSDTLHIHLTIIRSVLSRLCRFAIFVTQVSVAFVNTL